VDSTIHQGPGECLVDPSDTLLPSENTNNYLYKLKLIQKWKYRRQVKQEHYLTKNV